MQGFVYDKNVLYICQMRKLNPNKYNLYKILYTKSDDKNQTKLSYVFCPSLSQAVSETAPRWQSMTIREETVCQKGDIINWSKGECWRNSLYKLILKDNNIVFVLGRYKYEAKSIIDNPENIDSTEKICGNHTILLEDEVWWDDYNSFSEDKYESNESI